MAAGLASPDAGEDTGEVLQAPVRCHSCTATWQHAHFFPRFYSCTRQALAAAQHNGGAKVSDGLDWPPAANMSAVLQAALPTNLQKAFNFKIPTLRRRRYGFPP